MHWNQALSDDLEGLRANQSQREAVMQMWLTPPTHHRPGSPIHFPRTPLLSFFLVFQKRLGGLLTWALIATEITLSQLSGQFSQKR